jgi:hypothetical protein
MVTWRKLRTEDPQVLDATAPHRTGPHRNLPPGIYAVLQQRLLGWYEDTSSSGMGSEVYFKSSEFRGNTG